MEDNFIYLLAWGLGAFVISIFMEKLLKPQINYKRPFFAWLCHLGLILSLYAIFLLILGRPICAAGLVLSIYLILILVNNAKYDSLREPYLYQDYDYFLDVIRFPRLFLPFLGIKNFILCVLGCLLALACIYWENSPANRFSLHGQAGSALIILTLGLFFLLIGTLYRSRPDYNVIDDYKKLGFPTFLYLYGIESQSKIQSINVLDELPAYLKEIPHLVAIQSESFFDPRLMDPDLSPDILKNLDVFREEAILHGFLKVPAWGANTVRTEFSFLTGIDIKNLGPHQFNPYRAMLSGWSPDTWPNKLKDRYKTICLHPWYADFYGRKRLFPKIGFDEFMDIKAFSDCPKSGAYIDDRCLADKILAILAAAKEPTFIFAISMENHGPLQEDKEARERMIKSNYRRFWPAACPELPIYIDHLVHADLMLAKLRQGLSMLNPPVSLCFYGDHVPIMPRTYETLGYPNGETPYFCWSNEDKPKRIKPITMPAHNLVGSWLKAQYLM